jgi:hypothetical protein
MIDELISRMGPKYSDQMIHHAIHNMIKNGEVRETKQSKALLR